MTLAKSRRTTRWPTSTAATRTPSSAPTSPPTPPLESRPSRDPGPSGQARSVRGPVGFDGGEAVVVEPPRVEWTANGLAWAQPTANGWQIVSAPDGADAGQPTQYMSCKGVTPREIAMLSDGTV